MGQQRYATITWSGDVVATWDTLRRQIADGLNFCATGVPYWTLDVGGFFVQNKPDLWFWSGDYDAGVDDLGYRELFVRWFQYATFLPMLRAHGTDTPREIWRFGVSGDPRTTLCGSASALPAAALHLFARRLDDAARLTMLRLLAFDFRDDAATYDIRDQFMFGPAFWCARSHSPCTTPPARNRRGCRREPQRLPAGRVRLVGFLERRTAGRRPGHQRRNGIMAIPSSCARLHRARRCRAHAVRRRKAGRRHGVAHLSGPRFCTVPVARRCRRWV